MRNIATSDIDNDGVVDLIMVGDDCSYRSGDNMIYQPDCDFMGILYGNSLLETRYEMDASMRPASGDLITM